MGPRQGLILCHFHFFQLLIVNTDSISLSIFTRANLFLFWISLSKHEEPNIPNSKWHQVWRPQLSWPVRLFVHSCKISQVTFIDGMIWVNYVHYVKTKKKNIDRCFSTRLNFAESLAQVCNVLKLSRMLLQQNSVLRLLNAHLSLENPFQDASETTM